MLTSLEEGELKVGNFEKKFWGLERRKGKERRGGGRGDRREWDL